jgi:hypothetical protein
METMQEGFVMIRIKASTRQLLRTLEALRGKTMVDTVDTLVREEIARQEECPR